MSSGNLCAEQTPSAEAVCRPDNSSVANVSRPITESNATASRAARARGPVQVAHNAVELTWTVYGPDGIPNGFEALESEWNALLARSRFNTVFLTYEWQTTWWEYLGEGELWIVAMRRYDTQELVGIVPLYLVTPEGGRWAGKRKLNLVGCIEVSDYLDIIAAKDYETSVYAALRAWLCSHEAPVWDVLDLCNLPQDSLTYTDLPPLFQEAGLQVNITKEDVAPQFMLPLHYETYLQEQVDKKQRHEIRRKQRRAERETEVGFYVVDRSHNLAAEMDDFAALQRASREDKAEFMTPEMRRFFNGMAQRMFDAGYLRLCFLTLNGEKAAALLIFDYNRRFLLYNSGYDPEAHAHLSPGWVLLAYCIQYAIALGAQVFDFMQGDEEYKYRFGSQDYDVMRVIVSRDGK
jgi:CelD/BcsL family acetyltransferase involved in cellulose biosynthesis